MTGRGCALWFDVERAKREERRSRLAKAFSKLFKRRPTAPPSTNTEPIAQTESIWSDIPLHSLSLHETQSAAAEKQKSGLKDFGSSCKKFFHDVLPRPKPKRDPKPIADTIPLEFATSPRPSISDEVSMAPINSHEGGVSKASLVEKTSTQQDFQKLTVDQWRRDQLAMTEGTFNFPQKFLDRYIIKQLMGEGSFGFVLSAERRRDGREVAVKWALREKIPPAQWIYDVELGLVPTEVFILRQISHPSIVQFLDYFDDGGRYVCMVTELHGTSWTWPNPKLNSEKNIGLRPATQLLAMKAPEDEGLAMERRAPSDLFECIECHTHIPEKTIYLIFSQLLQAVLYLRDLGWVHRDLKDENIVVDENYRIKLVDFGSAAKIPTGANKEDRLFKQFNGTLAFAAPEIIKGHWYAPLDAEVWTLGILLFTLAYKKAPFHDADEIKEKMPEELETDDLSGINDLIRSMLEKRPSARIHLDSILDHRWMRKCQRLYSNNSQ